ncbi:4Fe-4S dicluster domain-containing protein [Candidatus Bipolaricaulota bacterium]|nr:4Fe-4S dicluster domain-containing protein [Candidatus Bipolaricaulota bacterium]
MKKLKVNAERCTGCESCVLSCSFAHWDSFSLTLSRVLVDRQTEHARFIPRVCIQCEERLCVQACPVGALSVNLETGAIAVAKDLCMGCRMCERACPYKGIHFVREMMTPLVCDLCGGDPECVQVCQKPKALEFVEY